MRRLLARYIMRRLWKLAIAQGNDLGYGSIGVRYNIVCLIPTILGGNSGEATKFACPFHIIELYDDDIKEEFAAIMSRRKIARHSTYANRWANPGARRD